MPPTAAEIKASSWMFETSKGCSMLVGVRDASLLSLKICEVGIGLEHLPSEHHMFAGFAVFCTCFFVICHCWMHSLACEYGAICWPLVYQTQKLGCEMLQNMKAHASGPLKRTFFFFFPACACKI